MPLRGNQSWIRDAIRNGLIQPSQLPEQEKPINHSVCAGKKQGKVAKKRDGKEKRFTKTVIDIAQKLGYCVAHFKPAWIREGRMITAGAGNHKGFPDLVMVRNYGEIIFAELKSEKGRLSKEQKCWIDRLRQAGMKVYVWRPSQIQEIADILVQGGESTSRGSRDEED